MFKNNALNFILLALTLMIISMVLANPGLAQFYGYSGYTPSGAYPAPYGYGAYSGYQPAAYGGAYGQYPPGYSPYGGSPYGGSPYGGSPYGGTMGYNPYGSSPYGAYNPYQPMSGYGTPYAPYSGYYSPYSGTYTGTGSSTVTYEDADVELDLSDEGDEITVDEGDTISIILTANHSYGYYYLLNDDDLDTDVVEKESNVYFQANGTEQWIFEAVDTGTTTITLEYTNMSNSTVTNTYEVEITVE